MVPFQLVNVVLINFLVSDKDFLVESSSSIDPDGIWLFKLGECSYDKLHFHVVPRILGL